MKGIDVAKWNGIIDWNRVRIDGVKFAVLKVINKQRQTEAAFERNYAGATKVGIPLDVYNYSYAKDVQTAISDAKLVVSTIKGKKIEYVWMDVEDDCQKALGMKLINMITAYQEVIEKAGYKFGVYTGSAFYNSYIKPYASHLDCPFWIARYNKGYTAMDFDENPLEVKKPSIVHKLWAWQYTSSGKVDGIEGNVDLNKKYEGKKEEFPILRVGSNNVYVGYLQEKLELLGYYNGKQDRIFGDKTKQAVERFQSVNGLKVDGIVGPNTWAKLSDKPIENPIVTYSLAKDKNTKISANFKVSEFKSNDGADEVLIDTAFVKNYLQKIRDHFKAPVTINSGYRTASYNKKVGGAANSYHVKGQAFDIVVQGKTQEKVAKYAYQIGVPGIVRYNTFVHVDSRSTPYYAINNNGSVTKVSKF